MRILIVTNSFPLSEAGARGSVTAALAEAFLGREEEVCVLSARRTAAESPSDSAFAFPVVRRLFLLEEPGASPEKRHETTIRNRSVTEEVISRWEPDVILVLRFHEVSLGPAQAAEESGIPVVYGLTDEHLLEYLPRRFSFDMESVSAFFADRLLYRSDTLGGLRVRHCFCTSAFLKIRLLSSGAPVGEAAVIHPGVDSARVPKRSDPGSLGAPPRILCVGGVGPGSGARTVIRVLPLLEREGLRPEVTFTGGGDGKEIGEFREYLDRKGVADRVTVTGRIPRSDLLKLYPAHDVFLFPSLRREPTGLFHLEAMACGLPVVSTLTGGQREFLKNGENALCFEGGREKDLAGCLSRILVNKDLRKKLVERGRRLVEASYGFDRYVSEIRDLLLRVRETCVVSA